MFWRRRRAEEPRGSPPPGQSPTAAILRWGIDHPGITDRLPNIERETWSLVVDGEVEAPKTLGFADLLALPQVESVSDFHCVEGWSVLAQRWGGVAFGTIQEMVKPKPSAAFALLECADGYTTSLPLSEMQGGDVLLAHRLNGENLSQPLGGPVRLVAPQKYAYKSAMWLTRITLSAEDRLGFWEQGYYSNTADVWKDDRYNDR